MDAEIQERVLQERIEQQQREIQLKLEAEKFKVNGKETGSVLWYYC